MPDSLFHTNNEAALELLRHKIDGLYGDQPAVGPATDDTPAPQPAVSKHQAYMNQLQTSGKSIVEIQEAWHEYYNQLPDTEKHEVWQEFYSTQQVAASQPVGPHVVPANGSSYVEPQQPGVPVRTELRDRSRVRDIRHKMGDSVKAAAGSNNKKLSLKHNLQSLGFGLGIGAIVVFIFLFSFFNEVILTPFLQPSRKANDTPVIVDTASVAITGNKVLIPKINLEIPVDYSQTTTSESAIELALDNGIVHYPTTVKPGQVGNAAFFGHSSNNIFNPGKYKFAFAFLHELQEGDTFYLSRDGTVYAYKVFKKTIVTPKQVDVLNAIQGHPATATLITCDPPGTSINRLVVVGDQVSPDPNSNTQSDIVQPQTAATDSVTSTVSAALPGNGPSLWSRIFDSIF